MTTDALIDPAIDQQIQLNDLSLDQKLRAVSLSLAVRHHGGYVCTDAEMYRELRNNNTPPQPMTDEKIIATAIIFESYLRGDFKDLEKEATEYLEAHPGAEEGATP